MKKRHVFATPSLPVAEAVMQAARQHGVASGCICLEARPDLEIERIADERKNVSMDFVPAASRGTLGGAAAGFLVGLVFMAIPVVGLSLAGAVALAVVGALVGSWASVLMGSALPDEVRRTFHDEIDAGKILVLIDAESEAFGEVETAIADAGGIRLPFECNTALT